MKCEQWNFIDGTPCAVKVACTVWSRGKDGDDFKVLPIAIVYGIAIKVFNVFNAKLNIGRP